MTRALLSTNVGTRARPSVVPALCSRFWIPAMWCLTVPARARLNLQATNVGKPTPGAALLVNTRPYEYQRWYSGPARGSVGVAVAALLALFDACHMGLTVPRLR